MAYLRDISAILGVSVSTVSKALKGYPDINEETRRRVIRTAEDIGYKGSGDRDRRAHDWSHQKTELAEGTKCCGICCGMVRKGGNGPYTGAIGVLAPNMGELLESACYREMLCAMAAEAVMHDHDLVILGADKPHCLENITDRGAVWRRKSAVEQLAGICLLIGKDQLSGATVPAQTECGIPLVKIETGAERGLYMAGSLGAISSPDEIGRAAVRRLLEAAGYSDQGSSGDCPVEFSLEIFE